LDEILDCYLDRGQESFTDDASLAELKGMDIQIFQGSYDNIKVTTPEDMFVAESILAKMNGK
jgi:2-C-methyl-D-erythritol 4-phosphate cytidylyltransferase